MQGADNQEPGEPGVSNVTPGYGGPERRQPTPDEIATVLDGQKLSSRRYRRERRITVLTSVVGCLFLAGLLSYFISDTIRANTHYNSVQNCKTQAESRINGNRRAFTQQQVLGVADLAFRQFPARFQAAAMAEINRDLNRQRKLLTDGDTPARLQSFSDLKKLVVLQPLINCDKTLK